MSEIRSIVIQNSTNPTTPTFSLQLVAFGGNNVFSNKKVFVKSIELLDWSYSSSTGARLPVDYINVFFQRTPSQAINDMRNVSLSSTGAIIVSSPVFKFVDGENMWAPERLVGLLFNSNQTLNQFTVNVKVPSTPAGSEFFSCVFRINWIELDELKPDGRAWERVRKKMTL